jgi:hypothetical protein
MKPEHPLPHVKLNVSRRDFNYIKRAVLSQKDTTAKRRVKKMLWTAQKEFFEDRRRLDRERRVDIETYTLSDGLHILREARKYVYRHTKAYWYDRPAQEAMKILGAKVKELKEEIKVETHRYVEGIPM